MPWDLLPDGKTEDDTERDGFLSYAGEWHALTIGVYRGLTHLRPWDDEFQEVAERYDDVANEPWYYKGGYVLGTLLQVGVALFLVWLLGWVGV